MTSPMRTNTSPDSRTITTGASPRDPFGFTTASSAQAATPMTARMTPAVNQAGAVPKSNVDAGTELTTSSRRTTVRARVSLPGAVDCLPNRRQTHEHGGQTYDWIGPAPPMP